MLPQDGAVQPGPLTAPPTAASVPSHPILLWFSPKDPVERLLSRAWSQEKEKLEGGVVSEVEVAENPGPLLWSTRQD